MIYNKKYNIFYDVGLKIEIPLRYIFKTYITIFYTICLKTEIPLRYIFKTYITIFHTIRLKTEIPAISFVLFFVVVEIKMIRRRIYILFLDFIFAL